MHGPEISDLRYTRRSTLPCASSPPSCEEMRFVTVSEEACDNAAFRLCCSQGFEGTNIFSIFKGIGLMGLFLGLADCSHRFLPFPL